MTKTVSDYEQIATAKRNITATPSEVWAVLSRLDELASWAPGIDGASVISEPTEGIGAVRRVLTAQFGAIEQEITGWRPNQKLAYVTAQSGPFSATYTSYDIAPADEGHATVTATLAFDLKPGAMPPDKAVALLSDGLGGILRALEFQAKMPAT